MVKALLANQEKREEEQHRTKKAMVEKQHRREAAMIEEQRRKEEAMEQKMQEFQAQNEMLRNLVEKSMGEMKGYLIEGSIH